MVVHHARRCDQRRAVVAESDGTRRFGLLHVVRVPHALFKDSRWSSSSKWTLIARVSGERIKKEGTHTSARARGNLSEQTGVRRVIDARRSCSPLSRAMWLSETRRALLKSQAYTTHDGRFHPRAAAVTRQRRSTLERVVVPIATRSPENFRCSCSRSSNDSILERSVETSRAPPRAGGVQEASLSRRVSRRRFAPRA